MRFRIRRPQPPVRRPRLPPAEVAWIAEGRRPFGDYAVGSLVPVVFEAYARVLHPAWAPSERKDTTLRWATVAAWSGRTIHALAQWEPLSDPSMATDPVPPFEAPPDKDGLDPDGLAALCDALAVHTRTPDDCFIGVWEGYSRPVEEWAGSDVLDLENRAYLVRRVRSRWRSTSAGRPFPTGATSGHRTSCGRRTGPGSSLRTPTSIRPTLAAQRR